MVGSMLSRSDPRPTMRTFCANDCKRVWEAFLSGIVVKCKSSGRNHEQSMNEFDSENCFTLALYGTQLDCTDIVPFMGDVIELFGAAGQPPSHLRVTAPGFGQKPLLFERAWKRLQKAAADTVTTVSVRRLVEDWRSVADWTTICCIEDHLSCIYLGAGLASMPDARPRLTSFVHRWLHKLRPSYGIGFWRQRGYGPVAYTIGLPYGDEIAFDGPEYEESLAICRWGDGMEEIVHQRDILRDVYPFSLLTPRHLQRDIDGRPLWAWIQAKSQRGQLTPFDESGEYSQWLVKPEHLPTVRRQLAATGALYVLERENHL